MPELTDDDVALILKLIDESPFQELHLETKSFKLHVNRRATGSGAPLNAPGPSVLAERASAEPPPPLPAASEARADSGEDGLAVITAPLLGTFYRAPKPGMPPFVEVGSLVAEETTVCIVEVMKLMNSVPAGVRGRIARVCATDGQLIEYGQALFHVEPAKG